MVAVHSSAVGAVGTELVTLRPDLVTLNDADTMAVTDCLASMA